MISKSRVWWGRIAVAILFLYWAALFAGTHLPNFSTGPASYNDKTAHFVGYLGLAFLLSWAWASRRPFLPRGPIAAALGALLYGALDELTQTMVPGRSAELADWFADSLGALTGIALFWILHAVFQSRVASTDGN